MDYLTKLRNFLGGAAKAVSNPVGFGMDVARNPQVQQPVKAFGNMLLQNTRQTLNTPVTNPGVLKANSVLENVNRGIMNTPVIGPFVKAPMVAGQSSYDNLTSGFNQLTNPQAPPSRIPFTGIDVAPKIAGPLKIGLGALAPLGAAGQASGDVVQDILQRTPFVGNTPIPGIAGFGTSLITPGPKTGFASKVKQIRGSLPGALGFSNTDRNTLKTVIKQADNNQLDKIVDMAVNSPNSKDYVQKLKTVRAEINREMYEMVGAKTGDYKKDFATFQISRKDPSIAPVIDQLEGYINKIDESIANYQPTKTIGGINPPPPTDDLVTTPTLPGDKQRGFLKTVKQSEKTTPFMKQTAETVEPQTYTPITNQQTVFDAKQIVDADPDLAKTRIFSNETPSAEKTVLGIEYAKRLESNKNYDEAIKVIEHLDQELRKSGQSIQAASLWNKLSPEGMLRAVNRVGEKVGRPLDQDMKKVILEKMAEIQKMPEGADKDQATISLLNAIAHKMPPKLGEVFEAYRYQNMLSSPKTQIRNTYSNVFNTLITRPLDLAFQGTYDLIRHPFNPLARDASLTNIPKYYKDIFTSLPNAVTAASQAFKLGRTDSYDLSSVKGDSAIEAMRRANMPKAVTMVPRLMEAQDKFFSTLIASGEKARLVSQGMDETLATQQARTLAERYLYREKLGSNQDQTLFVQALDSLGQFAMRGRQLPVIGKPYSWFVPFITTPINAAKGMVEHSPLGLVPFGKKKLTSEQIAKATAGSVVVGMGGMLAMQDRVTWDAPTDKKAKQYFYDSGKKPFSVLIGDRWVPAWYFGPFALSLMVPAAIKHNQEESRTALTDDQLTKIAGVTAQLSKFIVSQSSLQSVSGFFRMLDGDQDITAGSSLAFTAGQVIPLQGLIRYVNTLVDPVYRRASSFSEGIKKDLPVFSKQVQPIMNTDGTKATRDPFNKLLPYDTGKRNPEAEPYLDLRTEQLQQNAVINKEKKDLEREVLKEQAGAQASEVSSQDPKYAGSIISPGQPSDPKAALRNKMQEELAKTRVELRGGIQETADKYFYSEDGKTQEAIKDRPLPELKLTGNEVLDKELIADYKSALSTKINDVMELRKIGKLTDDQAIQKITELKAKYDALKTPKKGLSNVTKAKRIVAAFKTTPAKKSSFRITTTTKQPTIKPSQVLKTPILRPRLTPFKLKDPQRKNSYL